MKIEFLRDPDAAEIVDPEKFDRLKLVVVWISLPGKHTSHDIHLCEESLASARGVV